MKGLAGKVALVSGAGGPMGFAIAERPGRRGHAPGADGHLRQPAGAARQALAGSAAGAALRADATRREEALVVAALGAQTFGAIDVLVNVVGGIRSAQLYTPFLEMSEAQWDATLALNLAGLSPGAGGGGRA